MINAGRNRELVETLDACLAITARGYHRYKAIFAKRQIGHQVVQLKHITDVMPQQTNAR